MTKPFNLEEAKAGKPVQTRDGKPARIVCFDAKGGLPIVALIEVDGCEYPVHRMLDGSVGDWRKGLNNLDLVMASVIRTKWVNLFKGANGAEFPGCKTFDTEGAARKTGEESPFYMTTVKITWEE